MLEVIDLKKSFDKKLVLDGVTLTVRAGDVFGFIGCNGAGKSTTIKCILNFVFPDSGQILFRGRSVKKIEFRKFIGYLPEVAHLPPNLTAAEFLRYAYSFYGKITGGMEKAIQSLLDEVGLQDAKKKLIKTFSKGMKQRLGIAQAVIHDPELLILDEPFTGLDPIGRHSLKNILLDLNKKGKSIFFSLHNLAEVEDLCTVVGILQGGKVTYQGFIKDFISHFQAKDLEEAFLRSYCQDGGKDVECRQIQPA
jgi:ABC-2 type transport system ATP-binding protein